MCVIKCEKYNQMVKLWPSKAHFIAQFSLFNLFKDVWSLNYLWFFQLLSLPEFQASKRISIYLSTPEEVQTDQILKHIVGSKKTCFIPHYCGPSMKMVPLKSLEDYESLPLTKWNIKQPRDDDIRPDALETGKNY